MDLEESLGTLDSTGKIYERIFDLKIMTPQIVLNYATLLEDIMLSGGSDTAVIPIGLGGFVACRALSQRYEDPSKASRLWDQCRDGFVMGEGAGVLLLEELEHAKVGL